MAMKDEYRLERLACGRDPLEVVDQARSGRIDAHSRACPYCRQVITDDGQQRQLAADLQAAPIEAPPTLLPAVMSTVWSELRPGRKIPLPVPAGQGFATEQAISSLLQHALDQLPDLQVHWCRLDQAPDSEDSVGDESRSLSGAGPRIGEPSDLRVQIRAAAAYPAELAGLADAVRETTSAALLTQFGLVAVSIDVSFVDVYETQGRPS